MRSFFVSYTFAFILLILLFGAWVIGLNYGLFFLIKWLDIPFHFFGGFSVYVLWRAFGKGLNAEIAGLRKFFFLFLAGIGFVMFIGVFWEFFEFILDRFIMHTGFTYLSGVYEDTLSDLLLDFFGGSTAFLLYNKFYG
ncbi:MAG: hypothetical protein Q7S12_03245 [bacterium]|nr:hypothetical protein [bacterium]